MRHASFIDIGPNAFRDNREGDVVDAGDVDGVQRHDGPAGNAPPQLALLESGGPSAPGRIVTATGSVKVEARCDGAEAARPPRIVWDFGDGTSCDGPVVGHQYARPGFYRIGCTASDGALCSLAWLDVDILDVPPPPPSANHEGRWHDGAPTADLPGTMAPGRWTLQAHVGQAATFEAAAGCAPGDVAVHAHVEPYDGDGLVLVWPATRDLALPLAGRATLAFWIRARDPNIPAWQGLNPVLALHADDERWLRLTPTRDLLGDPPDIHFRDEWQLIEVPLAGGDGWTREIGPGGAPDVANWIGVGLDSWGAPLLDVWLDGLALR
jgi:hypothetical protein